MANNYNSNNFLYDKSKYINQNKRISTNSNLIDDDLIAIDPNEYRFEYQDRFDTYKGLFNTQQLIGSINFNEFQNHCFFDSAVSKTEAAFNQIYDKFPLDGTKKEVNEFLENIDGFTRNVYNQFEKNLGYLQFSGSYVEVENKSGNIFSFSRNDEMIQKLTNPILSPDDLSFSFDFRCYIKESSTQNQIIFQYFDPINKNGFTLYAKNQFTYNSQKFANLVFVLTNKENNIDNYIECKFFVNINKWNHIVITIDKNSFNNNIYSSNEINVIVDEKNVIFENINSNIQLNEIINLKNYKNQSFLKSKSIKIPDNIKFMFGYGITHSTISSFNYSNYFNFNNINSFEGFLDEFRFFHGLIDLNYSIKNKDKNIYAYNILKLYFRFNEPEGTHINNSILFDHSGNSLHSQIKLLDNSITGNDLRNKISKLREKSIGNTPLRYEEIDLNPVLIPSYQSHIDLNNLLIKSAKEYDEYNPNLIFKLFPRHYFLEGLEKEGYSEIYRNENAQTYYDINNQAIPGQNKKEASQTFVSLLLIWARYFDQLKLYLQILPNIIQTEYTDLNNNSIVNFFIPLMAKLNGFDFKEILNSPVNKLLDGYIFGKDSNEKSSITLRYIQNEIWKRIIINSKDIISSKGTLHSIRSIFNSVGIIPEEYYRFREYGTNSNRFIEKIYKNINKNYQYLSFFNINKNLQHISGISDKYYEYIKDRNFLLINYPSFSFENYYLNNKLNFNNLMIEFQVNYNKNIAQNPDILIESILKVEDNISNNSNQIQYELIFIKNNEYSTHGDLYFFIRDGQNNFELDLNNLKSIKDINLLDGSNWHISIEFIKYIPNINTKNKILVKVQKAGSISEYEKLYTLTYEFDHLSDGQLGLFNLNGRSKFLFGSKKNNLSFLNTLKVGSAFPNNITFGQNNLINKFSKITSYNNLFNDYIRFNGNISFIKMWKLINEIPENDLIQHAYDPESFSSYQILSNKNKISQSLLLDLTCQDKNLLIYPLTNIPNINNKYNIKLIDYSQNINLEDENYNNIIDYGYVSSISGSNGALNLDLLKTIDSKSINIKKFDIKFDELDDSNKVKIAGYFNEELIKKEDEDIEVSPVFSYDSLLHKSKSDIRFSIEMSNVKHLNEDMSNLLSNIEYFSNIISSYSQLNESHYIDFEKASDIYFERIISSKLNITALYEVYQIFDNILTELLSKFIADRVKFNNNIYVIESHAFERHKYYYKQNESQNTINGDYISSDGRSFNYKLQNSRRTINYLNKEGRILWEYN